MNTNTLALSSTLLLCWVLFPTLLPAGPDTEIPVPAAYWTFDNADVVDGRVLDSIGVFEGTINANDRNPVEFEPGRFDEALHFSGFADNFFSAVDFGHVLDPETESYSVSLWFNADIIADIPQFLIHKGNADSAQPGWSIWIGEGNGRIHCRGNWCFESPGCNVRNEEGKFGQFMDFQSGLADSWHHIAYVIDRENGFVRGYLDGSNEGWMPGGGGSEFDVLMPDTTIAPEDGLDDSNPTLLMGRRFTSGAPYAGLIDDVAIWKGSALTEDQVMALASGAPPVEPPPDAIAPEKPTGLTAVAEDGRVKLDWADNEERDVRLYKVKRSTTQDGPYVEVETSARSEFINSGLDNDTTYYYVVSANDRSENESEDSDEASAKPIAGLDVTPPLAPARLRAISDGLGVFLLWDAVTDTFPEDGALEGYNVKRSEAAGGPYDVISQVGGDTTEFTDRTAIMRGPTYFYVVTAVDPATNESAPSNEVDARREPFRCPGIPEAYWTFDATDIEFGLVFDSLGEFDGTIEGTVINSLGFIGEALEFPNSDGDFVDFDNVLDPDDESFTVSLWFNADEGEILSGNSSYLISKGNGSSEEAGWSIWFGEGNGRINCRGQQLGADDTERFGQSIDGQGHLEGSWHHLVYVIDRENDVVRGYLDGTNTGWVAGGGGGQIDTLTAGSQIITPQVLQMGQRSNAGAPFGGLIDDVAIWREALDARHIQALAEGLIKPSECELDPGPMFRRGDCNDSGVVDFTDAIGHLEALFLGTFQISCQDACDSNDDGLADFTDAIRTLEMLFLGRGEIPGPGTESCGIDPTDTDELGCAEYDSCAQ